MDIEQTKTEKHPCDLRTPSDSDTSLHVIALLGRPDFPTDGVRDYCEYLSSAFARRGNRMEIVQLCWEDQSWMEFFRDLRRLSRAWKDHIVLLQYTALMWSRHGFPLRALAVLAALKWRRARIGVVFHDAGYAPAHGLIRRLRVACQNFTIRTLFRTAEFPLLTVPASQLSWLPRNSGSGVFIPVGANFPDGILNARSSVPPSPTVVVFGVTGGPHIAPEVRDIAHAARRCAERVASLNLVVFGRNALEAESTLRKELAETNVAISVSGILPAADVRARLTQADVLLFVRGPISSRRGSAIAGIACGLPIVGYRGAETAPPITAAGVMLVDEKDRVALANALMRVLTNNELYCDLCQRSLEATAKYFSWDAIAARFASAFTDTSHNSAR
jgi:glycosyltransferase involved in cell wall biosynthesis